MNISKALATAACLAITATISAASYTRKGSFITVNPREGAARAVRIQVISDNIIRVEQTPEAVIPAKRRSLVVVPQKAYGNFTVGEDDSLVYVKAPRIQCHANKITGKVTMTDGKGKTLLSEHGKSFTPFLSNQTELPANYMPSAPGEINWGK